MSMKNQCRKAEIVPSDGGYLVKAVFPKHVGAYSLYYGISGRPLDSDEMAAKPFRPDEMFRTESDAQTFMNSEFVETEQETSEGKQRDAEQAGERRLEKAAASAAAKAQPGWDDRNPCAE